MTNMTLKIGPRVFTVATMQEALAVYTRERDQSGEGASTFPLGEIDGLWISYNGRIWDRHPRSTKRREVKP